MFGEVFSQLLWKSFVTVNLEKYKFQWIYLSVPALSDPLPLTENPKTQGDRSPPAHCNLAIIAHFLY